MKELFEEYAATLFEFALGSVLISLVLIFLNKMLEII